MNECSSCGTINTPSATRCACGHALGQASGGEVRGRRAPGNYSHLFAAGALLRSYGIALKYLGILVALSAVVYGVKTDAPGLVVTLEAAAGLALHVSGVLIAGVGEGLRAVGDIANNTAP